MPTSYCIARFFSSANEIGFIFMPTLLFRPFRWIHPGHYRFMDAMDWAFRWFSVQPLSSSPPPPSGKRHFCSSFFVKRKNSVIASSGLLALFTNGGRNYFWCLYINIWWLLWRLYVIMEYIYSYIETDFWWCRCFWPLIWRALPIDQPTATPVSLIWIISLFLNKRLCV